MSAKYLATNTEDNSTVGEDLKKMNQAWDNICALSVDRQEKLHDALLLAQKFHIQVKDIVRNLGSADERLKESLALADENHQFNKLSAKLKVPSNFIIFMILTYPNLIKFNRAALVMS